MPSLASRLRTAAAAGPPAAVPVTVHSLTNGVGSTTVDAASHTTEGGDITFTAGRHYAAWLVWSPSTGVCTSPATISTTASGLSFSAMACPGSDGSAYTRTGGGTRRTDAFIAYCSSSTTGTVTATVPPANVNFNEVHVVVVEIRNAHVGSAATDCLLQANRLDTAANASAMVTHLHAFADATNNAYLGFFMVGDGDSTLSASGGATIISNSSEGLFDTAIVAKEGELMTGGVTWTGGDASHTYIAYEVRAANSSAVHAVYATPTQFGTHSSGTTFPITNTVFTSGVPVAIAINTRRASAPASPTSVASASNTFTKVAASSQSFDTTGTPTDIIEWWVCQNPAAGTETVTVTYGFTPASGTSAVAINLVGAATSGTAVQGDGNGVDAGTTNDAALAAFSDPDNGTLLAWASDVGQEVQVTEGLRRIVEDNGQDGTNGSSWPTTATFLGVGWSAKPDTSPGVVFTANADSGVAAIEVKAA